MYGMSGFAEKLNIQNCENWIGNCVNYMHGMSRLAEKLNIPYCIYSMGNCVHYICTKCLDLQKIWICRTTKIQREIVYTIYVWNVWIRQKIECPKLRKFRGKFCTLHVQNVWMCRKIEYPEQQKFNRKLCTQCICEMSRLAKKLIVQNCVNSIGKCTLYVRNV